MKKTTASAKWAPIWLPLILAGNITTSMGETPLVLKDEDLRRTITRRFVDLSVAVPPVNLESPQSHPLALGPNGQWLAAVNTYGDRIELFELVDGTPQHRRSIHTGLDPVSLRFRDAEELWVANHVSDSITILELPSGRIKHLLKTDDEPADIVFSESGNRAFVSCSQVNRVLSYDLSDLEAAPEVIEIAGEDPRALAVSPDGRYVFAAVFESGNGTTVIGGGRADDDSMLAYPPNVVSAPDGPYQGVNPPPNSGDEISPKGSILIQNKPVSLIVRKSADGRWMDDNKGDWTSFVSGERATDSGRVKGWDLVDHDLAIIDTTTRQVHYAKGLMNICMAVSVNTKDGTIAVIGTDATNHIRYEPNLKGTFIRVQQATLKLRGDGTAETVSLEDLNPHLDYTEATVSQNIRNLSLGDPRAIAFAPDAGRAYIAGMGSNNIIVTDGKGGRFADSKPIEVGEGPTGLALSKTEDRLYVLNRFDGSISVVDTASATEIQRVPFDDPTPPVIKEGRRHLFDTHQTSGLGQASCASCHVDGRMDRLAWDLGDPSQFNLRRERFVDDSGSSSASLKQKTVQYGMAKGPMVTQTLQDIVGNGPFHWRGDQNELSDFNIFYETLLGDDERLTDDEMTEFENYLNTLSFPPNPFRETDNSAPESIPLPDHFALVEGKRVSLPDGDPSKGKTLFRQQSLEHFHGRNCADCHQSGGTSGGGGYSTPPNQPAVTQLTSLTQAEFKPSQLRNLHEKIGFDAGSQQSLSGFGYLHDGTIDTLSRYLSQPQFEESASPQDLADTIAFLLVRHGAEVPAPASPEIESFRTGSQFRGTDLQMLGILNGSPQSLAKAMHAGIGNQFKIQPEINPGLHAFAVGAFLSKAERSHGTLTAVLHATIEGEKRPWVYQADDEVFIDDRREVATLANLLQRDGFEEGLLTMVHPQMVARLIGDRDGDGLTDDEETRDLDPTTPGVQNPFDPDRADSTGFLSDSADGFHDALSDYDGDGVANRAEFLAGSNPVVADSGQVFTRLPFPGRVYRNGNGIRVEYENIGDGFFLIERSTDLRSWKPLNSLFAAPFNGSSIRGSFGSSSSTPQYFRFRRISE